MISKHTTQELYHQLENNYITNKTIYEYLEKQIDIMHEAPLLHPMMQSLQFVNKSLEGPISRAERILPKAKKEIDTKVGWKFG